MLAGRRGDRSPRASTPVLGLVLLGAGIAGSVVRRRHLRDSGNGAYWIGASAVVSVLGMILVVPVVVVAVGAARGRLPLLLRYAARDAARHRTRTVPAVAAVAATVAGVVALGIANASDERAERDDLHAAGADGRRRHRLEPGRAARRGGAGPGAGLGGSRPPCATAAPDVGHRRACAGPYEASDRRLGQPRSSSAPASADRHLQRPPTAAPGRRWSSHDASVPAWLDEATTATVDAALAAGRAVVFTEAVEVATSVTVRRRRGATADDPGRRPTTSPRCRPRSCTGAGTGCPGPGRSCRRRVADELGIEVSTASAAPHRRPGSGGRDRASPRRCGHRGRRLRLRRARLPAPRRGSSSSCSSSFALGGVLMLGGTLTATFLALSDARPDLATLSAVGAAPRTRRRIAAAYALVVGFVGAILGAGVGFIPGVAISRPLTSPRPTAGPTSTIPG